MEFLLFALFWMFFACLAAYPEIKAMEREAELIADINSKLDKLEKELGIKRGNK